jgi:hypothetical protein
VKIVIFGLTISSSWGNGHATLWRGLCKALIQSGHDIVFYERNVAYYAEMRDLNELPGGRLELYEDCQSVRRRASIDLTDADVAIITSYCPDSLVFTDIVLAQGRALRVFYDLDTPVTLARLEAGECVPYIPASGLGGFDLVLSYRSCRSGSASSDAAAAALSRRSFLFGNLLGRPPGRPRGPVGGAGAVAAGSKVLDWRRSVPAAFSVVFQYLFRSSFAAGRTRRLLLLVAPDP